MENSKLVHFNLLLGGPCFLISKVFYNYLIFLFSQILLSFFLARVLIFNSPDDSASQPGEPVIFNSENAFHGHSIFKSVFRQNAWLDAFYDLFFCFSDLKAPGVTLPMTFEVFAPKINDEDWGTGWYRLGFANAAFVLPQMKPWEI
jgi:hypothetical protein